MTTSLLTVRLNGDPTVEPVILIVNRDQMTRDWIHATAVSAGLRAISFDSGSELLECFASNNAAACAILDVALPDAGFDLQDKLHRAGASVLYLTRERCIAACVRAMQAGAVDFLTIPCEPTELVPALRRAVQQAVASQVQRQWLGELSSRYARLTLREREVFALVSSGMLNKQIAQRLEISEVTVQIHRGRIMKKMGARSFAALVRMADVLLRLQPCDDARGGPALFSFIFPLATGEARRAHARSSASSTSRLVSPGPMARAAQID